MKNILTRLKASLASLVLAGGLTIAYIVPPVAVHASTPKDQVCQGVNQTSSGGGTSCNGNGSEISNAVAAAIRILSIIAGIAAVIMLIFGGLKYITSSGDASSIASAKNTIIYAIIGLIIVALAQVIVRFVLGSATAGSSGGGSG